MFKLLSDDPLGGGQVKISKAGISIIEERPPPGAPLGDDGPMRGGSSKDSVRIGLWVPPFPNGQTSWLINGGCYYITTYKSWDDPPSGHWMAYLMSFVLTLRWIMVEDLPSPPQPWTYYGYINCFFPASFLQSYFLVLFIKIYIDAWLSALLYSCNCSVVHYTSSYFVDIQFNVDPR